MSYTDKTGLDELIENAIDRCGYMDCMIVTIKLKYEHEAQYRYTNELLLIKDGQYYWKSDWWEGEQCVEYVGIIPVDKVRTWKFNKTDDCFVDDCFVDVSDIKYSIDSLFQKLGTEDYINNFKNDPKYAYFNLKESINNCIDSLVKYTEE